MSEGGRVFGLDLLRAFAILCVVYSHGSFLLGDAPVIPRDLYMIPVFDGVGMFFVLSGFLIGRILLRTVAKEDFDGRMLLAFWVRRWFRTLPNYFFVLAFLLLVAFLGANPPPELLRYLTFTQNFARPHPPFFPEAWSLAVEEWFYLLIPIPLYLSSKIRRLDRRAMVLVLIAAVIVFSTALRLYRIRHFGYADLESWDIHIVKQVVTRMDSLMFGVLGAYVSIYHATLWRRAAAPALAIGMGLLLFDKTFASLHYKMNYSLTVSAVGTLLLLPKLSAWRRSRGWVVGVVTFVSVTSYSMYLLNYTPVQHILLPAVMGSLTQHLPRAEDHRVLIQYVLFWVMTVTASYLLYRYFELPMTSLRDRWPTRGHPVVTAFAGEVGAPTGAQAGGR